jgi:hypothetical protein
MIEALKQALDALKYMDVTAEHRVDNKIPETAIAALKEALAQEKALQALHDENERLGLYRDAYAEPVAWRDVIAVHLVSEGINKHRARELAEHFIKLTTPPQRTWVGLTGETLLCAAQSSLSPEQYEHFEAMAEYQPEIYDRLAKAIKSQLKEQA